MKVSFWTRFKKWLSAENEKVTIQAYKQGMEVRKRPKPKIPKVDIGKEISDDFVRMRRRRK